MARRFIRAQNFLRFFFPHLHGDQILQNFLKQCLSRAAVDDCSEGIYSQMSESVRSNHFVRIFSVEHNTVGDVGRGIFKIKCPPTSVIAVYIANDPAFPIISSCLDVFIGIPP
ncbi:hypothetical protein DSY4594 [Desulfitobacterium hafniense Y51]|uniref:Uncharacterized protein n=1 Tax=Desulfitobacterium hafniense (strain Y51) TaxID=138119 RepID=Q24NK9_DESHY|nr:hypothetical protein DSY4594 [Desulfitobacterium hafniense Y51]